MQDLPSSRDLLGFRAQVSCFSIVWEEKFSSTLLASFGWSNNQSYIRQINRGKKPNKFNFVNTEDPYV